MNLRCWKPFYLLMILLGSVRPAIAAPPTEFHVGGAVVHPQSWTVARLNHEWAQKIQNIRYTLKGVSHTARAVSLLALIQASQPHLNPHIKNHVLQFVVAVQGQDGYTADFSLAELLPQFGHRAAWLVLEEDGKPLPADAGPVELVVPDDAKPGRWVRAVAVLTVVDGAQPVTTSGT